jgi:hypothetical protein
VGFPARCDARQQRYKTSGLDSVADPVSGMGKKSGSGSGMNNSDHISESLKTILGLKYLNSLIWIRDTG